MKVNFGESTGVDVKGYINTAVIISKWLYSTAGARATYFLKLFYEAGSPMATKIKTLK